jgi:peptide-methionine (S)-S-oxide reductase
MDATCDIVGTSLRVPVSRFPDPQFDPCDATAKAQAVFAGGCFWCIEAVFKELKGVLAVTSGYAGGDAGSANYQSVCSGGTEHAEVIRIQYEPTKISFGALLNVFFSVAHDPTQLNRQGNDRGTQYRSAIFYTNDEQKVIASRYIEQLNNSGIFNARIMTELSQLEAFYDAEDYHQNYAERNPNQPYIAFAAQPKIEKLREYFSDRLKTPCD